MLAQSGMLLQRVWRQLCSEKTLGVCSLPHIMYVYILCIFLYFLSIVLLVRNLKKCKWHFQWHNQSTLLLNNTFASDLSELLPQQQAVRSKYSDLTIVLTCMLVLECSRNLPTTSCRTIELKSSRHSRRSIVWRRIGSQRDSRRVSGPDRLAWMGEAKGKKKITPLIAKSLPKEVGRFWEMSACWIPADSCLNFLFSLQNFKVSGAIFSTDAFLHKDKH